MKFTCIKIGLGLWLSAGFFGNIFAQEQIDPLKLDYFMDNHLWFQTNNAAGLTPGGRLDFSELYLGAFVENGKYHRPQQSDKSTDYLFSAKGGLSIGQIYLTGNFNFKQAFDDGMEYTSVLNPYRGTPYIIADSTGGDWRRQAYDMSVRAASPVWFNCLSVGIGIDLAVERGAKKTDPRPQGNSNQLNVYPSFAFLFGEHSFGGVYKYRRFREDTDLMLYNAGEHQKLYLLRGLGQYFFETFNTTQRQRNYTGSGNGGSLQYAYKGERFSAFLSGNYAIYREDTDDIDQDRNRPKRIGKLDETEFSGSLNLSLKTSGLLHKLDVQYSSTERKGTEIGQRFAQTDYITVSEAPDRSVCKINRTSAMYQLHTLKYKDAYNWSFGLGGTYEDYSDEYLVAASFIRYSRINLILNANKNLYLGENGMLQFGLEGNYSKTPEHSMAYKRANETEDEFDKTIQSGLILPDYDYLIQDCYGGKLHARYNFRFPKTQWFSVGFNMSILSAANHDMRNSYLLRIGYMF